MILMNGLKKRKLNIFKIVSSKSRVFYRLVLKNENPIQKSETQISV